MKYIRRCEIDFNALKRIGNRRAVTFFLFKTIEFPMLMLQHGCNATARDRRIITFKVFFDKLPLHKGTKCKSLQNIKARMNYILERTTCDVIHCEVLV